MPEQPVRPKLILGRGRLGTEMERETEIRRTTSYPTAGLASDPCSLIARDSGSRTAGGSRDGTMVGSTMEAESEQLEVASNVSAAPAVAYQRGSIAEWTVTAILL